VAQREQASQALSLYCAFPQQLVLTRQNNHVSEHAAQWLDAYHRLQAEITVRQYSPKTLQAHSQWIKKFQGFTRNKEPGSLSAVAVKDYMKFLAIKQNVLTIHDGKGGKDRTVPLPQSIVPDLHAHLQQVKTLHQKDMSPGMTGYFVSSAMMPHGKAQTKPCTELSLLEF